jgi:oligopeptidase A
MNPLLNFTALPQFKSFTIDAVAPAMSQLIAEAEASINAVLNTSAAPTWDNVITPIDDATEKISRAWGMVSHLNAVNNSPALREAYTATLPAITQFWTSLSQNEALFAKYKQIRASSSTLGLNGTQNKVLDNEIRDFRLGGAELSEDNKIRFQAIQASLATLMSTFNDNVLDATNAFTHDITEAHQLGGLPADVVSAARELYRKTEKNNDAPGWRFSLHAPSYVPVMQYAAFHPLRETMYRAYVTRASELCGNSKGDNTDIIKQILALRAESAALLGYHNYAEVSLAAKMAASPNEVIYFLNEMAAKAKPFALADWAAIVAFAKTELNMADVSAWDVAYISEKLRESQYAFSDNEVKQYFPAHKVIDGLFRVVTSLYGVNFVEAQADTWANDVKFFSVVDNANNIIGQFYFDMYARETKRGGAWMDDAINRRRVNGKMQHPVAYMTCNFSPPVNGKPALLTHDDVITLFHEFGHGLHQLLTEVDELSVSGISGVEWDAVELPSQFMENFCWEWEVLQHMTAHVDTGAPLPRALFDKMLAAKNFQSGMGTLRQIEFALLDMLAHTDFDFVNDNINALAQRVRADVAVVPYPHFNRMPQSFGHIFGGGYAAGYYSYKWAEVLSADAYAAFEETGVLNAETGKRFRDEVLARGGSRGAMESFVAFRGRKPEIAHLLRHQGMSDIKLAA